MIIKMVILDSNDKEIMGHIMNFPDGNKREEALRSIAETAVWTAIRASYENKLFNHSCTLCDAPLSVLAKSENESDTCDGKCEERGMKDKISLNEAIERITDALDRRS